MVFFLCFFFVFLYVLFAAELFLSRMVSRSCILCVLPSFVIASFMKEGDGHVARHLFFVIWSCLFTSRYQMSSWYRL